ncbi:hypothetical protein [Vibrio phage PhiImVa-1]|nr:hypothetical protein [Vibrio phage PhiImVa-1]
MVLLEPPWLTQIKEVMPHEEALHNLKLVVDAGALWDTNRWFHAADIDDLIRWAASPQGSEFWNKIWENTGSYRSLHSMVKNYFK